MKFNNLLFSNSFIKNSSHWKYCALHLNQIFYTKLEAYFFNWWHLLLVLSHTACTASAVKTLLAQLEPLLDLVEILKEIHCWWIRIVDV
jgi:hypothetical protein